jgi:hypothetical protein
MMLEVTVGLGVAIALGLAFQSARWIAAVGVMLLIYMYSWTFLALSIAGGVTFYFIRFHKRRTYDVLPDRSDQRD